MALSLFRRHRKACKQTDRYFRRCACPIHVEGTLGNEEVRKGLNLTSWEAAQNLVAEWNRLGRIGVEVRPKKSVKEAVTAFLSDCRARNLREGTVQLYEQTLSSQLLPWCESEKVPDLQALSVEKLREFRGGWKCAPTTASLRIYRLRTFFGFCVDAGWVEKNPASALKRPANTEGRDKTPFTDAELGRIYQACDELVTRGTYGKENRARVKAFVYILRYTGLRISDAAKLDDTRVRDGRVFLRTTKTGSIVSVPIPEFVSATLAEVPRTGPYYFQTGDAKAKTVRNGWDRTLRTILTLAKVHHGSAHVFRHTLASELLSKGVPVETVAAILGNSEAIVRKHYAHWIKARQDALDEAVRSVWQEPKPQLRVIQGGAQ
jgi:site-specific recombinase XerD